jgi:hypothetical protein
MSSETATVAASPQVLFPFLNKVSLLDRATTPIKYLDMTQQQLQTRLQQEENETARLRQCVASRASILILY